MERNDGHEADEEDEQRQCVRRCDGCCCTRCCCGHSLYRMTLRRVAAKFDECSERCEAALAAERLQAQKEANKHGNLSLLGADWTRMEYSVKKSRDTIDVLFTHAYEGNISALDTAQNSRTFPWWIRAVRPMAQYLTRKKNYVWHGLIM